MPARRKIKGTDKVIMNLNKEIKQIKGRSMQGLIEAVMLVRVDMEKTPPLIPVDTGNLRASWFTSPYYKGKGFGLIFGFSANYAIFVHEMMEGDGGKINWNRPGSGPKFLQASLFRNEKEILDIIKKNAKF